MPPFTGASNFAKSAKSFISMAFQNVMQYRHFVVVVVVVVVEPTRFGNKFFTMLTRLKVMMMMTWPSTLWDIVVQNMFAVC